jgi:Na+/H+ antiporter NhaC
MPTSSSHDLLSPLTFRGGLAGALAPFAVFFGGVGTLAMLGAPDEKGFWPVLLAALIAGLLLTRDRARYAEAMLDGMSQRLVMIMLCAWLFAGVLGALLRAGGVVQGLAGVASLLGLGGGAYVAVAFLTAAVVSTATGTSFGTILLCGPILYPAGVNSHPAALMGAILAGATVGDSMSPVSDTTIASSGTQGVDIGGTVRARMRYAVPAGLMALVASTWLGGRGTGSGTEPTPDGIVSLAPLAMLLSPMLAIGMLLARRHLIESLLLGITSAVLIGLAVGALTPHALLHVAPGTFGATGVIVDGMQRAVGVSVFTILLMGLVGTLQVTDVLPRLVATVQRQARTARGAEWWMVGVVSAAVLLTTHSVVAILAVGEVARQAGERFGLDGYRRANLLDLTVCTWPFLLPYFLPTILAAGTTRSEGATAMPALTAGTVGLHNTYAWALLAVVVVAVVTGYGRRDG